MVERLQLSSAHLERKSCYNSVAVAKRLRQSSHFKDKDRISELPDEILVLILCCLTTKGAARTSVLSHRWRNLWIATSRLNFSASKIKAEIEDHKKSINVGRREYIRWVNKFLDLHAGLNFDEFTIRFSFGKRYHRVVDKWFSSAMHKGVKRLVVDLTPFRVPGQPEIYDFPMDCYNLIRSPHGLSSIKTLKSISFSFVNVTAEILEHFLSNCPLLEQLSVTKAKNLLNLKVVASSLQLKSLEIKDCYCLQNIEICAPNLVSFSYSGQRISLPVLNLPLLVHLSMDGCDSTAYALDLFASFASQLETLMFRISLTKDERNLTRSQFPQFINLKHLTLLVSGSGIDSLLDLFPLIKSFPSLHRLTMEVAVDPTNAVTAENAVKCPHHCLKVLEIFNYRVTIDVIEFIVHVLANAVVLETIIIYRAQSLGYAKTLEEMLSQDEQEMVSDLKEIKYLEWLKRHMPPTVELIIL